jgi:hypothetical protein
MIGRGLAACALFFIAALISTLSAATDDGVKVEVERPRLVADKAQGPILAGLNLVFDARFTNQGDAPIEIPDRAWTGGVAGISMHGVESQQSDESWRTVEGGGDLMWKGDTVFPGCKLLNPKETLDVKGVSGPFVVFKSNLYGLSGTRATIRLYLALPCKQRDGKVMLKTVKTDPFVLSIPPLP